MIGIITLPPHANYGGIIQAWSMQQVLNKLGFESELILPSPYRRINVFQKIYLYPIRAFKKLILKKHEIIRKERIHNLVYSLSLKNTSKLRSFTDENIKIRRVNNLDDVKETDYEAIVIGSDQIWRPQYSYWFDSKVANSFGWFARKWNNVKILSYSASFGISSLKEFSKADKKRASKMLKRFSGVAVREKDGIDLCAQLGANAFHVLDPTMLIEKCEYEKLIPQDTPARNGIMTYILDPTYETDNLINHFKSIINKDIFSPLSKTSNEVNPLSHWLAGFRDADLIITDSFHACVFSIIFQKPFIVIGNPSRGLSRIHSLLSTFNLEHHFVESFKDLKDISNYTLDINTLTSKLQCEQNKSLNFFQKSLNN